MCLIITYEPGIAYKLFKTTFDGGLSSPLQSYGKQYQIGKWIKDTNERYLPLVRNTVTLPDGRPIDNLNYEEFRQYQTGFHCWPSLEDALAAVRATWYLKPNPGDVIYRIAYKKLLAQGIDESSRPTLVVKYMKLLEKVKQF